METTKNLQSIVITEDDFNALKKYIAGISDKQDSMSLAHELSRAVVVKAEEITKNVVRLNSTVSVLDLETNKVHEFVIVLPEHANIKQNKISVLTPMGTALLGFRIADEVRWRLPGGLKRLRILNVSYHEKPR